MRFSRVAFVLLTLLLFGTAQPAPAGAQGALERELDGAKALYRQGRLEDAVNALQTVVVKLNQQRELQNRTIQLTDAYLHLGLAHLAMRNEAAAIEDFRQVVALDPQRTLDPEIYAPRVVELFERTRSELPATRAAAGPSSPPATGSAPIASLPALAPPRLLSPVEGAVMMFFPHVVDFAWIPVAGAVRYRIEVDSYSCGANGDEWCSDVNGRSSKIQDVDTTRYTSDHLGGNLWRWRVTSIDAAGRFSVPALWRQLVFASVQPPATISPTVRDPVTGEIIRGAAVAGPVAVYSPRPVSPRAAIDDKVNGQVFMDIVVGPDGRVQDVRVTKSLRPDVDKSTVAAVRTWRFAPAQRDGKPVAALVSLSIAFVFK